MGGRGKKSTTAKPEKDSNNPGNCEGRDPISKARQSPVADLTAAEGKWDAPVENNMKSTKVRITRSQKKWPQSRNLHVACSCIYIMYTGFGGRRPLLALPVREWSLEASSDLGVRWHADCLRAWKTNTTKSAQPPRPKHILYHNLKYLYDFFVQQPCSSLNIRNATKRFSPHQSRFWLLAGSLPSRPSKWRPLISFSEGDVVQGRVGTLWLSYAGGKVGGVDRLEMMAWPWLF